MASKRLTSGLAVLAVGLAGCGGSSSSSSHAARPHRTAGPIYHLKLTGRAETPPGAPTGAGDAVIALHDKAHQVCWRFSHLHGFSGATFSHIHKAPAGKSGPIVVPLSTGRKLHHRGCVHTGAAVLAGIAKDPHAYYVNIHSKAYPGGAVRAQL
jgi:hypothetical protein